METIASVLWPVGLLVHVDLFFWARLVARSIFEDRKWSDSKKILMKCPAPQGGVSSTAEDPLRHSQGHGQLDEVPALIAVRLGFGLTVLGLPSSFESCCGFWKQLLRFLECWDKTCLSEIHRLYSLGFDCRWGHLGRSQGSWLRLARKTSLWHCVHFQASSQRSNRFRTYPGRTSASMGQAAAVLQISGHVDRYFEYHSSVKRLLKIWGLKLKVLLTFPILELAQSASRNQGEKSQCSFVACLCNNEKCDKARDAEWHWPIAAEVFSPQCLCSLVAGLLSMELGQR